MRKAINKKIFFATLVVMFAWHEKAYTQSAPSLPSPSPPPPVSVPNHTPFPQTPQANIPTAQQKEYTQQELEAERARGTIFANELSERVIAIIAHEEGSENSLPDGWNPLEEYDGKIEKMFIEEGFCDNHTEDPFLVSNAETVLEWLGNRS